MYLTVCPLYGTGQDIALWENECISLSVLSMARVMMAQRNNEGISLYVRLFTRVKLPAAAEYFKGFFLG